jgi:hypothetical protein
MIKLTQKIVTLIAILVGVIILATVIGLLPLYDTSGEYKKIKK